MPIPTVPSVLENGHVASSQASQAPPGPLSIVVFGASGDLAKKKTFPALFNLFAQVHPPPVPLQEKAQCRTVQYSALHFMCFQCAILCSLKHYSTVQTH